MYQGLDASGRQLTGCMRQTMRTLLTRRIGSLFATLGMKYQQFSHTSTVATICTKSSWEQPGQGVSSYRFMRPCSYSLNSAELWPSFAQEQGGLWLCAWTVLLSTSTARL